MSKRGKGQKKWGVCLECKAKVKRKFVNKKNININIFQILRGIYQ